MSSLIWKEWHEQRWKLAFGCFVIAFIAAVGLRARILPDETMCLLVCVLGVVLLPILSSTGLIPAERAEETFESLISLPVAPWRILVVKTIMGLLLCIAPLLAAAIVSLLVAGDREIPTWFMLHIYVRATFTTVSLFIWMLALTAHLPSETRAALLAIGLLILWTLATVGIGNVGVPPFVFYASPIAAFFLVESSGYGASLLPGLTVQPLILFLLLFWTARRFTRGTDGKS